MDKQQLPGWPGWETVRLIGRGSFGAVYEIQQKLGPHISHAALKVIRIPPNESEIVALREDGYDNDSLKLYYTDSLQKIQNEYALMSNLKGHSNVVYCDDILSIPHVDGFGWDVYLKMELLTPLKVHLSESLTEEQVIKLGVDICKALVFCDQYNIIHRDIKPENIFVARDGNYKLGDFGIAKTMEGTCSGTTTGTYDYMSPEVHNNQPYNARTDIYSLGLVLHWMLNERTMPFLPIGTKPTPTDKNRARERRFSGEAIPAPIHGSEKLKQIILKACAYNSKDRYASAKDMLTALNTIANDDDVIPLWGVPSAEQIDPPENEVGPGTIGVVPQKRPVVPAPPPIPDGDPPPIQKDPPVEIETNPSDGRKNTLVKKRIIIPTIIGIAVLIILLLLKSCDGKAPVQTEPVDTPLASTEGTLPVQTDWSDWMDELPSYVTDEYYDIEEQILYSTSTLERTTSTESDTMDGWELYDTVEADGGYSPPSEWTTTPMEETDTRKVESKLFYAYRTKETTTGSSPEKAGWTLYNTTYTWGNYGSPSGWSTNKVAETESRKIETKTQYAYRDKEYTTSSDSSLSGWTLYDTTYSAWGNAQTTNQKPKESSTLRIVSTKQTGWGYYHWCNYYYNGGTNWNVDSIKYGDQTAWESMWHGYTSSFELPAVYCADKGGQQAYGGSGSGAQACLMGFYFWFRNPGDDTYSYTYETRTPTYHYYRWPEKYSNWTDTPISESDSRDVITQVLYQYQDREQIPMYHFYRYGSLSKWSEEKISESNDRKVETERRYRYYDLVTETTYCFQRWTEPTEFLPTPAIASDEVKVETKTQFRFKSKDRRNPYSDLSSDATYYEPVIWVTEQGIMNGTSADIFTPDGTVSRGQMVTLLWRAVGKPEPSSTTSIFSDVDSDSPYLKAVLWATEAGIAGGESDDTFGVDSICNRAQVITFLYRAVGSPEISLSQEPFSDVEPDAFYYHAVLWAYETGVSSGVADTEFGVNNRCNRAQVAVMLYRTFFAP